MKFPTIEKNIPIPKGKSDLVDFISQMEKGDSFVVHDHTQRMRVYAIGTRCRFVMKSQKIGAEGYRIWRVE